MNEPNEPMEPDELFESINVRVALHPEDLGVDVLNIWCDLLCCGTMIVGPDVPGWVLMRGIRLQTD